MGEALWSYDGKADRMLMVQAETGELIHTSFRHTLTFWKA